MLGNRLITEWENVKSNNQQKFDWISTITNEDKDKYEALIKRYNKKNRKKNFNIDTDVDFVNLNEDAKSYFKSVGKGKASIDGLNKSMSETMKVTGKSGKEFISTGNKLGDFLSVTKNVAKTGLKGFGKALLGGGLNMLLNAGVGALIEGGITLAVKAYDKLAHAQEKTIEKGKEASQKIQDNYSSIASNDQWKNTNLERFTELAKGVSTTGKNISLTTEEFSEYQSLASDLAGIMPNLVVGFNELGQPIIKAATNMDTLNKAFRDSDVKKYQENMKNTSDVLDAFKTQYDEVGNVFKESGIKQKLAAYKDITSIYNDLKSQKLTDWQGNNFLKDRLRISDKDGYDYNTIKDISKDLGIKTDELYENIDAVLEGEAQIRQEMDMVASSVKNSLPSFFKAKDSYHDIISKSPNVDAFVQSLVAGLDSETILNTLGSEEDIKAWAEKITSGLQNKEVQEAIDGLYTIDQKKTDMSFKAYDKQVRGFVKKIGKNIDGINEEQVLKGFDLDEEFSDLGKKYNEIANKFGKDFANGLSISDLELATEIISQQDVENAQQLSKAMQAAKQAAFDMNANPIFDKIAEAKETKNSGDDYVKATTYLKEAKEMFDKGLVGTDDFKSIAKYFSPTGSEDPANFLENYGKAARYLTEDGSGVVNFLNDLSTKTDEAGNALANFDKQTGKWTYNISDLHEASQKMGMGFEFFVDMFGRLEDYGFSNNFVTSQEQGIQKIVDKTVELAKEKQKLAEMERTGKYYEVDDQGIMREMLVNDTVLNAQREKVAGLEADVQSVSQNLEQFVNDSIDATVTKVKQSKEVFDILKQKYDELEADPNKYGENTEAVKKRLTEQLKTFAAEAGLELDGNLNIVNKDEVQSELESEPVELPIDINASFDEVKEKAQNSLDEVQKMVFSDSSITKVPITLDLEADNAANIDAQIASIIASVDKLKNEDGIIDISAPGAQDVINVLMALIARKQEIAQPVIMSVDTGKLDGDLATVIGKLQEFQTAYNELERLNTLKAAGINVDTSDAQTKLNNITSEIQNLDGKQAEIMAKVVPDTSSVDSISATLSSMEPEVLVNIGVNSDAIANYNPEDKDADVNYHVEDSKIQAYDPPDKDAIVKYSPDTSGLPTSFTPITRTVNYVKGSDPGKASGTMLSPAHANGTAYNTLNMSPAHAGGNVAIQRDEKALVNELPKPESIVRDGIWSIIPGGAHIEQLKKGDIIFNGEQTEQLLKHGSISGHGRAYVDGTANVRDLVRKPLSAYASGSGGGILGAGGSGSKANFGSGGKSNSTSKTAKNTKKIAKNTKDAADSAKEFEETLDHIETLVDRTERNIKNLERTATSTYETLGTRTDALKSELSEITKEIDIQSKAYDRYLQEANSVGLSEDYAEKVRNGLIDLETITDEELNKSISQYREYYEKALDCRDAVEELKESVKGLYEESFNNLVKEYDNMLAQIEHRKNILEGYIEQTETQGYIVSTKYYAELIKNEQSNLEDLTSKRNSLLASLNDAVANGNVKMYSESWYEMRQEINDVDEAIQSANTSIIEYGNSIRNIKWDVFDKLQDKISSITDESDFLIDLMSNDKLFDDKGNITEQGKASMGLHGVNYNTYMSQADQYRKEMEAIQAEIAKDPYNQELIDRRKELLELQQESIIAAENEKEAIKDLVEEGIDKQLESLQDLIDKQGEMLDSQKDMYDWQKEIAEKQKDIATLEKMLGAYSGDDSEEGMAKRQELSSELGEAKTELDESFFEKSISEQKKLLDELYTQYELVLNTRLDNLDMLITDMIANINSESSGIRDTIISEAANVGHTITDSMSQIWTDNTNNIAGILTTYSSNFSSVITSVQQALNEIKVYIQNAVNASNKKAETNINTANKNQADQVKPPAPKPNPPAPKPEPPKNNGEDGVPKIGDAVTFASGRYYYSSDGLSPSGNEMLGQTVYIGHINNASWAKKPYAIYRDKEFKRGLGWVTLDQLKGYKTGKKHIDENQIAMINEKGVSETLIRKDGTMITQLDKGDSVLNHKAHNNIWEMANNPRDFINNYANTLSLPPVSKNSSSQNVSNTVDVNIEIGKVTDLNSFLKDLQNSKQFEQFIEQISIGKALGKPTLTKYNIKL